MKRLRRLFSNWVSWLLEDGRTFFFLWGVIAVSIIAVALGWLPVVRFLTALTVINTLFMFWLEAVNRPKRCRINWSRIAAGMTPAAVTIGWALGRFIIKLFASWI